MQNKNRRLLQKVFVLYFDPFSPNSTYSYKLEGGHSVVRMGLLKNHNLVLTILLVHYS